MKYNPASSIIFCRHGKDQEHVAWLETHSLQPKKLTKKISLHYRFHLGNAGKFRHGCSRFLCFCLPYALVVSSFGSGRFISSHNPFECENTLHHYVISNKHNYIYYHALKEEPHYKQSSFFQCGCLALLVFYVVKAITVSNKS